MKRRHLLMLAGSASTRIAEAAASPEITKRAPASTYPRSEVEIEAGVVPTNYEHPSGPSRYGALGDNVADDTPAWIATGRVSGYHFVQNGHYSLHSKAQTAGYVTIVGASRQSTWLMSKFSSADHVFEVGSRPAGPNPNVGALERLRFSGNAGNTSCLHMQNASHMWRLNDLLFSGGCPALIIDNCWDSNYTNLDILGAGISGGTDPAKGASVIIRTGSNNLFFRGLRIEAPVSGGLYVDGASAIRVTDGKIDNGFAAGQGAPSLTVTATGELYLDQFYIGGQYTYQAQVAGSLTCAHVTFDGGTGQSAAIHDIRAWTHINPVSNPGVSRPSIRPAIPRLDLGHSIFNRTHSSVNTTTPSAVFSKIFPIRILHQTSVTAIGAVAAGAITIATSAHISNNDQYTGCYLVHNATGTQSASRRKILSCFIGGQMTVAGASGLPLGPGWSIEYCGGHCTPILSHDVTLQSGASLFHQLFSVRIAGAPTYDATPAHQTFGMTTFTIVAMSSGKHEDLTGLYLIDEATGEPFMIGYGIDSDGRLGVMYDRTTSLRPGDVFVVQAGYAADVYRQGSSFQWTHAGNVKSCLINAALRAGFDRENLPLWGMTTDA